MATIDYGALKKGGFMRQKQKGKFSLRLGVVGGNLDATGLATVAEVAKKYGHGYVHMTSRQGIEIPFIDFEDIEEVKAELAKGGVRPGVCGPRVRTVTACQGSEICPSGCIDSYAIAQELDKRYFGRELPHKFKFGVTGCQNNCLKAEENDVGIKGGMTVKIENDECIKCGVCEKACRENAIKFSEETGVSLENDKCTYCGRCVKACPTGAWKGESLLPIISDKDTLFRVTDAAINWFGKNANPSERFRNTLQRVGEESFRAEIQKAYEGK